MTTHSITLELLKPGTVPRIHVKQGDSLSRAVTVNLTAGGEPWAIPANARAVIRYFAADPATGESARGTFDTLPTGESAITLADTSLTFTPVPGMFALPGIVQTDIALIQGPETLATFNFEFYVNQSPVSSTRPDIQDYYKVATLEQINQALDQVEAKADQNRSDFIRELQRVESELTQSVSRAETKADQNREDFAQALQDATAQLTQAASRAEAKADQNREDFAGELVARDQRIAALEQALAALQETVDAM